MTTYVLNSLIVPADLTQPLIVVMRRSSATEVSQLLKNGSWESAVGHEGTASLLSKLLGVQIPTRRVAIQARPGDTLIHFALKTRLPEGRVLTEEELQQLEYDLVISEIHRHLLCVSCQELIYPPSKVRTE